MTGRAPTRRKPAAEVPAVLANVTDAEILEHALTMPGNAGDTYTLFIDLSLGNQIALLMQGVSGPVNTYARCQDMNRQVTKGAQAKYIRRPLFKKIEENGKEEQRLIGFKWVKCMFEASDTEGDPLPEFETPEWSEQRALGSLAISRVAFEHLDGNVQGYSYENNVAINPVAAYPRKTLIHEMGHVVLGHTKPEAHEEYKAHRGVAEFEAEGTAYVVMNRLDQLDSFDADESRFYIQSWLGQDTRPPDESLRSVIRVAGKIITAGRPSKETNDGFD